jgi:hypothetical protein
MAGVIAERCFASTGGHDVWGGIFKGMEKL